MSQPTSSDPPPRRRGCCLGRLLGLTGIACVLAVAALYFGLPQRAALHFAARGIGATANIGAIRMSHRRFDLASFSLRDPNLPGTQPVIDLRGLQIDFDPFNANTPFLTALSLDSLDLHFDGEDPAHTNYAFLEALAAETPERPEAPRPEAIGEPAAVTDFTRLLPHAIRIGRIAGVYRQPGFAFEGGPIAIEMTNPGGGTLHAAITGEPIFTLTQGSERIQVEDAELNLSLTWQPDALAVETRAVLPPWANLDARADLSHDAAGWHGLISIDSARIDDLPEALRALLPLDADAKAIFVTPSQIAFETTPDGLELAPSTLEASATGLRLGPEQAPWFHADARIELSAEGQHFAGRFTHDDARSIDFSGAFGPEPVATVHLAAWTYPDLEAITPVDYLDAVALFASLDSLDAQLDIVFGETVAITGALSPAFGLDPAWHRALDLMLQADFTPADSTLEANATLRLAEAALSLDIASHEAEGIRIKASMLRFDLPRLAQLLALAPPQVRELESLFTGAADILITEGGSTLAFDLEATPPPFLPHETLRQRALAINANFTAPAGFRSLSGSAAIALAPHFTIDATTLTYHLETTTGSARLTGATDIGALAAYLELGPIAGDLTASGPIRFTSDALEADFSIAVDGPAFDGIGLGYGDLLTLEGTAIHPFEGDGALRNLVVTAGGGTRIDMPAARYTTTPLLLEAPALAITSDGLALIGAGYLDGMRGILNASGGLSYTPEAYDIALDYTTTYDLLTLRNALAVLSGGAGEGQLRITQDGLGGQGVLSAQEIAVFGVLLQRVRMPIEFDGPAMRFHEFEAALFNGRVHTNGRIGLLEDGLPVEISARLRSVDLVPFSEAFLSPETRVTGIANGHVRMTIENWEITAFEASLRSARDFTINRNFLAQLIMSDQVGQSAGRTVSGVLSGVLGEAPQRPFDSAEIDLALRDGLIRGTIMLRSSTLNLTVNLTMDPRTVVELMRLNQRSELDRMGAH